METLQFNLIAILCVLLAIVYRRIKHIYTHWETMGVAFEKPVFLFGNMTDNILMRRTPGEIYKSLYEKFRGERFVGIYRMMKLDMIVLEPEDIKRVLITDFSHFNDRFDIGSNHKDPLFLNMFSAEAKEWKPMRQTVSPAFTTSKLKKMIPLILEVADEFTKYLDNVSRTQNETEFREIMATFSTDVIGSCAFGIKMNSMQDENAPFRRMGRKIFQVGFYKFFKIQIRNYFPRVYSALNMRTQDSDTLKFFVTTFGEIVKERENGAHKRNDFIDLMLEIKAKHELDTENGDKATIDEEFIFKQAFIFFVAGFESSSTLMSFTLYELALHPEIQNKVYKEICTVLDKHNGNMSYDIISEMTYLDMVVSEAQRKYPLLGNLIRMCTRTYTFPDSKVTVHPKTWVTVPLLAIHYDPKYYPEPEKFIPERFTPEAKAQRNPMLYLPFGDGPRNCVGLRLGKMQSIIGLITVLKDFTVEPCSKTRSKIVFNPTSIATHSKHGVWMKLKKRNNDE